MAQSEFSIVRGERPPVNFSELSDEHYHKGVLIIKFSPELEKHLEQNQATADKDGIVKFNISDVDKLNQQFGVTQAKQHFSSGALKNGFTARHKAWGFHLWYRLQVDEKTDIRALIEEYKNLREIEVAEPELVKVLIGSGDITDYSLAQATELSDNLSKGKNWQPNDPQYSNQWHYENTGQQGGTPGKDISLPEAWELEKGSPDVLVAIVDGGIDYNHNDLAGNMWPETGFNFVTNSNTIEPHNHGTHVAGTIAAVSNNNLGVAGIAGGSGDNDGVRLMSAQVFTAASSGGFHLAPVYAADNGAAISQNSWGYTSAGFYEQNVLDAIDYFNVNGGGEAMDGGITIFAAGNSDSSEDYYPGYYSGAFSVAATNNNDQKSWYSNYGSWVDISAPGGETNTVTQRGVLSTVNGNQYAYYQGTSMACPHVSGLVALMLSAVYGEFSTEDITDILINTVDNHYATNPGFTGQMGAGRINAYNAVALSQLYLSLPSNPTDFEAIAPDDSQIDLSWQKNENNDRVMLAYSSTGSFGIPLVGTAYQAGDVIDGGGTVLLVDDTTSFAHTDLNAATLYYYRIWSVTTENDYSLGRSTNEYTQCGVLNLPSFQDFNSSEIPYCWLLPDGGNWAISTDSGNPAPGAEFNWSPSQTDYSFTLESPPLDGNIPGNAIALEFDLLLNNYSSDTEENMNVQVFDGGNWITVESFSNAQGDIDWEGYNIDITPYAIDRVFKVRFTATGENSYNINYWVIDNFAVYSFSCPMPVNIAVNDITTNAALVTWEAVGAETQWDLLVGPAGFNPETGGMLIAGITQESYLLESLETFSNYQLYVRADCSEGDISLWNGPIDFSTLASCPAPENLQVSQITSETALVSWDPVGNESSWTLAWGNPGFNPDNNGNAVELSSGSYVLEGLESVTSYEVYVFAYCDETDQSVWIGPESFTTVCDVYSLPFTEYFDAESVECWAYPQGKGNWGNSTSYAPPSSISGTPHATFTWSPSQVGYSYSLTSPLFDASFLNEPVKLDFVLLLDSYNNENLEQMSVEYKAFEDTEWSLLLNYTNEGAGNSNIEFKVEGDQIPGMEGRVFQIRFRAHGQNTFSIDGWGLDDVSVYQEFTQCYEPVDLAVSDVTATSATISWDQPGAVQSWEIIFGEEGFNPQTDGNLVQDIETNSYLLDELAQLSSYHAYVKAVCGAEDNSEWVGPLNFTTLLQTYTILIESSGFGTVEPLGEIIADHGSDHVISVTPDHGSHLASVKLDGAEISDQMIMDQGGISPAGHLELSDINADHHLMFEFARNRYQVTLDVFPDDAGTVTGDGEYVHGQPVSVFATGNENYQFLFWKENDLEVTGQPAFTFSAGYNRYLVAHFQDVTFVEEGFDTMDVEIYPNPASQQVWVTFTHLQSNELAVKLLTTDGRIVAQELVSAQGHVRLLFDLSDLSAGVYLLSIGNSGIFRRVIVH